MLVGIFTRTGLLSREKNRTDTKASYLKRTSTLLQNAKYLFISTSLEDDFFKEPEKSGNTEFLNKPDSLLTDADRKNKELDDKHNEWEQNVEAGKKLAQELNNRFAKWYYVISSSNFDKLNIERKNLVKKKEESEES